MTQVYDSVDPNVPDLPLDIVQFKEDGFIDQALELGGKDNNDPDTPTGLRKRDRLKSLIPSTILSFRKEQNNDEQNDNPDLSPRTTAIGEENHPTVSTQSPAVGTDIWHDVSVNLQSSNRNLIADSKIVDEKNAKPLDPQLDNVYTFGIPAVSNNNNSRRLCSRERRTRNQVRSIGNINRAGWEPGADVETMTVPVGYNNPLGCQITVVDYSATRHRLCRMEVHSNGEKSELLDLLRSEPEWSRVRWINVSGHREEAVKTIGGFYDLHRLSIEDMVFGEGRRTKAEKYPTHTFCCLPLFKCMDYKPQRRMYNKRRIITFWRDYNRESFAEFREMERRSSMGMGTFKMNNHKSSRRRSQSDGDDERGEEDISPATSTSNTATAFPRMVDAPICAVDIRQAPTLTLSRKIGKENPESIYKWNNPDAESTVGAMYLESRRPLASMGKALGIEQVYLFLTENGTVISFFDKGGDRVETPVLSRIGTDSTILRESSDPSMLLQAIIDCIVDEISPIISEYRRKLDELEIAAVTNPTMGHTQDLHLLNAELTILRNKIVPITSLINSLRDHSSINEQGAGRIRSEEQESEIIQSGGRMPPDIKPTTSSKSRALSKDISDLAVVYLADVADHTMTYTQDLDVMRNNAKSMTELIFNTISIQSSDAVRLLSLVTVVFLPLTFLTGYYGMNFTNFQSLNNSVEYYWGIAVPFCVCMTFLLMWQWVRDKIRTTKNSIMRFWSQFQAEKEEYTLYKEHMTMRKNRDREFEQYRRDQGDNQSGDASGAPNPNNMV